MSNQKEDRVEFPRRQWFRTPQGRELPGNSYIKANYKTMGYEPIDPPQSAVEAKAAKAEVKAAEAESAIEAVEAMKAAGSRATKAKKDAK